MTQIDAEIARQYDTDCHLQTRIHTHRTYSVGPQLEDEVDCALQLGADESLLDVGTGPGRFPARLHAADHRGRLVGADLSMGMIEAARAAFPGVEFVQAPADHLPFPDHSFDVLSARHMLYHVPDVAAALREFRRVLRSGGRFLATTNAADNIGELWAAVDEAARLEPLLTPLRGTDGTLAAAFSERNGLEAVRAAFGDARLEIADMALLFPSPEPVLEYLASMPEWLVLGEEEQARGRAALLTVLEPRFRTGPWRVPKRVALITTRA